MKNITSMQNPTSVTKALSSKQLLILCGLGIFFWFVFALLIQFGNGLGIFGGMTGAAIFLGSIPVAWLFILVVQAIAGLATGQIFMGLGFSSAIAGLCDGIALTWIPSLYGKEASDALLGAGYILWGLGISLILAYGMDNGVLNRAKESKIALR